MSMYQVQRAESSNEVKFSIITVCLNALDKLKITEGSIAAQTYNAYEWLVIDGASDDGTIEYIKGSRHVSKYISEPDSGLFHAMNKGIGIAKGEYCLFINAGDYLYDEKVLENIATGLDADVVVGSLYVIPMEDSKKNPEIRKYLNKNIYCDEFYFFRTLPHQATFIKKTLFSRFGCYDTSFKIEGDREFFIRAFKGGASFKLIDVCVAGYELNGISWINKNKPSRKREVDRLRRMYFSLWRRIKIRLRSIV
jgi:glycosyltransferase involved in cell wall biosynthesis